MLGFIIPFKRKTDSNWEIECFNLKNTLNSVINQIDKNYKVFVVYSDIPDINFSHNSVEFIKFPYEFKSTAEITKLEKILNPDFNEGISDKVYDHGKRLLYGSYIAKEKGCEFIMPVDADDFVSNKLSNWVNLNKNSCLGWYVDKGFIKFGKSKVLIKVKKNMNLINGSTHIIHVDLLPDKLIENINPSLMCFFSSHGYLTTRLKHLNNIDLIPIPFYAVMYFIHGKNWLAHDNLVVNKQIRNFFKKILRGKYLTSSIKKEFGIH